MPGTTTSCATKPKDETVGWSVSSGRTAKRGELSGEVWPSGSRAIRTSREQFIDDTADDERMRAVRLVVENRLAVDSQQVIQRRGKVSLIAR